MNTGEESALPMVSASSSASNMYEGTLSLEEDFSSLREVEVVRELGLITCERGVFGQGPDSSVGGVPVVNCPDVDHMEEEVQVSVQVEEKGKEKHTKRNKVRNRESKNGQPHNVDDHADEMTRSCRHLSQCVYHTS